ncbi:MAG: MerR family transcriptional regulator, partial [Anaerolineae bacterium]|nr:MerR family transcriptional regulator [Anaerolineae bacterium]
AGVTVRTLRYYDQRGLLAPSAYSESGQRLYSQDDDRKLQQILALKLLGLSLEEIRTVMTSDAAVVPALLERQKQILQAQVRQRQRLIQAIEQTPFDLETLVQIIRQVKMFTEAEQAQLTGLSFEAQKQIGQALKTLVAEILAQPDTALIARWDALMEQWAQGDSELAARLTVAYLESPAADQPWAKQLQAAVKWIQQAREQLPPPSEPL